ncbi:MAG: phosphate/phosphite/phosphonate ABC transporter substrate-binding protein, partial [Patescibacteria group bacterium]|nr:phosphate/phosphite/phosphonate ABC transporter substrate-binding protein [Patescibacteria group bacterium]
GGQAGEISPATAGTLRKRKVLNIIGLVSGIIALCLLTISFWAVIAGRTNQAVEPTGLENGGETIKDKIYYLGILPLRKPSTMLERFSGLEKYLRDETGLNIRLRFYSTAGEVGGYTAVVKDITSGKTSFAWLASVTTVQAYENGPIAPFVCPQKSGSPTYQGGLAVKIDSPHKTIADLKGKKVYGSSKSSTSGNLMPSAMLEQEGINKETYFDGGLQFSGSHDKAAEAVLAGIIDACFINDMTFDKYNTDKEVLRYIWKHDPVPEFPFVVNTEKIAPEKLVKVKNTLLKMHETNLEDIRAISPEYEKWVTINWEDYLGIKESIDKVYGPVFYNLDKWSK